ncbi:hypothetical protein LJR234_002150 [Mesorhizobium amorphae]|uniref:hypothetical protein n=1 Tax=Mesorhizobium amorphae TaxID=71433 RepID=UPI003ED1689B
MNIFPVAHAAFEASLQHRTWCLVQFREGGRIIETAKTGGYHTDTKLVDLEWRRS